MKATKVINHNKVGAAERVDGISVGSVTTASITEQGYTTQDEMQSFIFFQFLQLHKNTLIYSPSVTLFCFL